MWRSIKIAIRKRSVSRNHDPGENEGTEATVPVETKRLGLIVLSDGLTGDRESVESPFVVDIVALHGLNGDAYNTWTHQKSGNLWLRDQLPRDLPGARIYTYGYPSHLLFSKSKAQIRDYASKLLSCLSTARVGQEGRPIIFIAHSLGGIVCKQALILAYRNPLYSKILDSTTGILFFGTPHRGARGTPEMGIVLGNIVDLCLKSSGSRLFMGKTRSDLLASLSANSSTLRDVAQDFTHILDGLQIITFYELEEKAPLGRLIVDQDSAIMAVKGERAIPMHADHTEICRFAPSDASYGEVLMLIKEVYKEANNSPSLAESEKVCVRIFNDVDIRDYRSTLPARTNGTCQWLLSNPQYDAWATEDRTNLIWITGHPGCGKTILSSYLTEQLQPMRASTRRDPLVCSFFCNDGIENQRDAKAILRSLIFQILIERRDLIGHVKPLLDYDKDGVHLLKSYDRLWSIFSSMACDVRLGRTSIIIDALDECEKTSRNMFMESIAKLIDRLRTMASRCVRFLITSRPYLTITECFTNYRPRRLPLEERQKEIDADVRLVIGQRVEKIARRTNAKQETIKMLERSLNENADRTFLWAKFALDILDEELLTAPGDFQRILAALPRDLEATYQRFLSKVRPGQEGFATNLLRIIIASVKPLSLDEISFVDAMQNITGTGFQNLADVEKHHLRTNIRADINNVLGPLVRISDSKVYLVHISLKEFLCSSIKNLQDERLSSRYHINLQHANTLLASACMTYLSLNEFSEDLYAMNNSSISESSPVLAQTDHDEERLEDAVDIFGTILQNEEEFDASACTRISHRYKLYEYAATSWARHFAESQETIPAPFKGMALKLSEKGESKFSNWFRFYWANRGINIPYPSDFDALVIAAFFDHYSSLEILLSRPESEGQYSLPTALYWASRNGSYQSVIQLLQTAVEPDSKLVDRQSPLCIAAQLGHLEVAKALVADIRVDVNFEGRDRRSPLSMAAGSGNIELVRLLLSDERTAPDQEDSKRRTPLFWAIDGNHPSIIRLFTSNSWVNVNHTDDHERTPFSWAAEEGNEDVISELLKTPNIDVNRADVHGRSPLSWAAEKGHVSVIKQLKRSKRLDTSHSHKDNTGRNALGWAAGAGQDDVIKLLLKYGLPGADEEDDSKWTPLFWALEAPTSMTVATLLNTGQVNVNHKDHSGRTALFWTAGYGNEETVRILLAFEGIDAVAADDEGLTPLDWAVKLGKDRTVRLLEEYVQRMD